MTTKERNLKFSYTIAKQYIQYCNREGLDKNKVSSFIQFLLVHGLIRQDIIDKFITIEMYPEMLYRYDNKTAAIHALEDQLPYAERHLWTIVAEDNKRFLPDKTKAFL